ncbi:suppressor of SWI4 1 homolog [Notechis scutatus]|uniref:Suppressor of SWI4 1 homolog n=1 Tax=Notechis scutatus TaxID=8663 RepID=A0A6J1UP50_9SAUR|nr:suppressor of SWI4 1 homolog [Notechis scutatus]
MGRPSKTKNQKKERAASQHRSQEEYGSVPHSFVFHRGRIGKNIQQLIQDVRRVMEPYSATSLKVRKKNSLKDFVTIAGPLGVTHFLVFTKNPTSINLRLLRLPGGPTLTFRVTQYSLIKDVVSSLKRHRMHEQQFNHPPLLVLNNFGIEGMHIKVMATMFQNMFPSINVHKVSLNTIKRCVLVNYNPDTQIMEFRHYSLKVVPVGMSKGLKKLLQEKFPNMSRLDDISELLVSCCFYCAPLFLDLFPQSTKRRRRLSQSTTPKKKGKYVRSVQGQSQERTAGKTTTKHKKASQPGRQQRQPRRGTSQHCRGKLSQQQQRRNTRPHRKPQNLQQKQPQAAGQPRGKRQAGFRPPGSRWQGKSRLGQKQAFKGRSTFRKARHSKGQKSA